jgi:ssRNA-specific RNase YbeY (16S rRNA maturation enzyme)
MHLFREKALAGSLTKRADRNDLELEIARLVLHGVLHLAGHDHHTLADGRRMASATRRYLRPFALQHSPSA